MIQRLQQDRSNQPISDPSYSDSTFLSAIFHSPTLNPRSGFTIVELLVVIVVIGILAAITLVSYAGISQRAIVASLQSNLDNNSKKLKLYQALYGSYPTNLDTNNCPTTPVSDANYCLNASSGETLSYTAGATGSITPQAFYLTDTSGTTSYAITNNTAPTTACPTGFIPVPGSSTYGTKDFCVMKYDASQVGNSNVPISQPGSLPWVNISQYTAMADAPNVANCPTCHLITEAEYLTIAQNVLGVPSNWSSGTVGSGYIYSGHNDNAPANALAADPSDNNDYAGTGNFAGDTSVTNGMIGNSQRRTLTLSNGQVIWDMAGNIYEWTQSTSTNNQPGISGAGYAWRNYTTVTTHGTFSPDPFPVTTGISGASSWTNSNGIGQIYSNANETATRGFIRGGAWYDSNDAGVLSLSLNITPGDWGLYGGFRVSR